MMKVMMNLTSKFKKPDLIRYYDYLNESKEIVFNSFYELKNNRELKLSILLDDKNLDILNTVEFEVNKATSSINSISSKIDNILNSSNLLLIRESLELYAELLDDSIKWVEYVNDEIEKIINI